MATVAATDAARRITHVSMQIRETTSLCCSEGSTCGIPTETVISTVSLTEIVTVTPAPMTATNSESGIRSNTGIPQATSTDANDEDTPIGTIVGGVIGGAALLLLVVLVLLLGYRRDWFKKAPLNAIPTTTGNVASNEYNPIPTSGPISPIFIGSHSSMGTPSNSWARVMYPQPAPSSRPASEVQQSNDYYEMPLDRQD
ncbi:predicted protein [Uncinocarpus reesii 1704]|uniref:Mid2 domain-containing protein n=1 Tax=Uncinocarpus reesii (strain UAMH 1704) TaxID=336963 RepID=C4JKH0_UNCRE|nr:uncharacterized protein UREG_02127 [Uncinocarpus reesii 1704]EEP77278.1 predicted protein [Uncinocarpus reesii 1704]